MSTRNASPDGRPDGTIPTDRSDRFAALVAGLVAAPDAVSAAAVLCRSAEALLGDGGGAAVLRLSGTGAGGLVAVHGLDGQAAQRGLDAGAGTTGDPVRTTVLGDGLHPAVLVALARGVGCGHALAVPVATQDDPTLWLAVVRRDPVEPLGVERAWLLASHGSLGMHAAHLAQIRANLQTALETNRHIATAVGIIMATGRLSAEAAFDVLRQASQHGHRKLADVASDVVFTGAVPD